MFFKRLELSGFKSFGHKTVIDFREGFTVVVGPNGCGKSNILDGIRWVLGETSAKSLRGARMGDVVFRGSASTKPAGLANVTLTVDNSAGHLQMDQPEISVTRRLFSSGESQYQMNKVPCRMRDIHDLFLDTGLGADGYSVIEQGQIGQMVSAKPNERREIFEEAAGISRYKTRREETVRKLARTEDDLNRLLDLVGEVERQCNSLRYQARKAQRHRRLTRRVGRLQQRLLILRYDNLSQKHAEAKARLQEMQNAFEQASAAASQAEAAVTQAQAHHDALQRQLQALQQQRHEMQRKLDGERHRVEMAKTQMRNIDERIAAIDRELESRQARLTVMSGTMEALEADARKEEESYAASERDLRERTEKLEALRGRTEEAEREIARLRAEAREMENRQNTLLNDKRVAETIIERLKDDMGATEFQVQELSEQIAEISGRMEEARTRMEGFRGELEKLREETRSVQERIGQDDRAKKELGSKLESLARDLSNATSRLQALKELEESYEGYFRGVKEVMRAADRGELAGMIGVVSSLITVPKELEIAVEVALGGDVQDIVTENVEAAKQAIGFLKRKNFGRATFLPLGFLHTDFPMRHLEPIWGRPGVLGLGRDLVTFQPEVKEAVHYLFGNTVFVEHLDLAVELEREGIRNRFVSLTGDVVNPRGVLSGGSHQTRGLLSRQREIRQLAENVQGMEGQLQAMREEMAATKDRLGSLYGRAAELQSLIHRLEMDEASAHKDFQQLERELREKRNQHASVEARASQQRVEQTRQTEIVERCVAGLAEVGKLSEEATAVLTRQEEGARGLLDQQQQLSEEVAEARETQSRLSERVAAVRQRLEEMRASIEESESERTAREEEKVQLQQERERAILQRDEAEGVLGDLSRELEGQVNRTNDKSAEIETHEQELRRLASESQRLVRDRTERDNALREVQMETAELRAQVDYLEEEASEDFGLPMEQIRRELEEAEEADRLWREQQEAAKLAEREARRQLRAQQRAEAEASEDAEATEEEEEQEKPAAASTGDGDDDSDEGADPSDDHEPATTPEDDAITDPSKLRALVAELRTKLQRMGAVNEAAIEEYAEQNKRLQFLVEQRDDVQAAKEQLEEAIRQIDETTTRLFNDAYESIRDNFQRMFSLLFNGGEADLRLVEDERFPEPGIEIFAQPPGKRIGGSSTLLSGGEKALTAIALMFSLFQYRPSPICVLDEIDAPLDDVNVRRLCDALRRFARDTQFLVITHNKITMSLADTIYGVTMQEKGVSKVVSVNFDEAEEMGLVDEKIPAV